MGDTLFFVLRWARITFTCVTRALGLNEPVIILLIFVLNTMDETSHHNLKCIIEILVDVSHVPVDQITKNLDCKIFCFIFVHYFLQLLRRVNHILTKSMAVSWSLNLDAACMNSQIDN